MSIRISRYLNHKIIIVEDIAYLYSTEFKSRRREFDTEYNHFFFFFREESGTFVKKLSTTTGENRRLLTPTLAGGLCEDRRP